MTGVLILTICAIFVLALKICGLRERQVFWLLVAVVFVALVASGGV